jgi:DNA-binding transcriptional MerR regulator
VDDAPLSIGALARATGLPVSALRFYDAADVLRPAHVDPTTGYRWYASGQVHTARLIARLRRAGLPVADLVAVLKAPHEAHALLAGHQRRLEEDLAAASAHLDAAAEILAEPGRCTVAAADLVAALAAVRHAVAAAADPDWPGLAGVLLHLDGRALRVVACDRFRLAVATVSVRDVSGPPVRVVAPSALVDEVMSMSLPEAGPISLSPRGLDVLGLSDVPLSGRYPDYQQLLRSGGSRGVTVPSGELLETAEGADDVVVVRLSGGRLALTPPGPRDELGFSRAFVLDAVRAARAEHVLLSLDDGRSALSVSSADRPHDVGLVMPIRLRR